MTLDFVFKTCTGHDTAYWSERGELEWFNEYADKSKDAGKGILSANWNNFPHGARKWVQGQGYPDTIVTPAGLKHNGTTSESMRKFERILESAGYRIEWSDQTSRCEHCYGAIHTDAEYYGDTSHYAILGECDIVCEECIRKDFTEEYLEGLEVKSRSGPFGAVSIRGIDPSENGYVKFETGFEYGFHPGQTDNPKDIYAKLDDAGIERVLFVVDDSGQFDMRFSVWRKKTDKDLRHASFNRFEIAMSLEDAEGASHQGQCDEDVEVLTRRPEIASQLEKISDEALRDELKECGAWDTEELEDRSANELRIVWIAACNIAEEERAQNA